MNYKLITPIIVSIFLIASCKKDKFIGKEIINHTWKNIHIELKNGKLTFPPDSTIKNNNNYVLRFSPTKKYFRYHLQLEDQSCTGQYEFNGKNKIAFSNNMVCTANREQEIDYTKVFIKKLQEVIKYEIKDSIMVLITKNDAQLHFKKKK